MFKLNKKGQASSTFQLLIAAIVALAILGVLISVIGGLDIGTDKPDQVTNALLRTQVNYPGVINCTNAIKFKRNSSIGAEGLVENTGLDPEQIFISNAVDEIPNFRVISNSILTYNGSSDKKISVCIVCSKDGSTGLTNTINTYASDTEYNKLSNVSTNEFPNVSGETLCLIYAKKSA